MRNTMNDRIEPAGEEDLVYPDESSEFFNAEELEEEKKNIDFKGETELQKIIKKHEHLANNFPPQKNFQRRKK